MECPICRTPEAQEQPGRAGGGTAFNCIRCGQYVISGTAFEVMKSVPNEERWKVSAWVRERRSGLINSQDIESARITTVPGLLQRATKMLRELDRQNPHGREFTTADVVQRLVAVGWNRDPGETRYMLHDVLEHELGYVKKVIAEFMRLTAKGQLALEGVANQETQVGFCAMWFGDEVRPLWTSVIEPAIRLAGYEPLRIDAKPHNGKIDDEIMASIRGARFVVADFTGNRGGVYYEAGFAHGLGLPVIFMCREGDDLHFDIRQYNCIFWKSDQLDEAKTRLTNRIKATLGQGPLKLQ